MPIGNICRVNYRPINYGPTTQLLASYYKAACIPATTAPAPTLSPSLGALTVGSTPITGSKYLYTVQYGDMTCTTPTSGTAYPLNRCVPNQRYDRYDLIFYHNRYQRYMIVTAAYSHNVSSLVLYTKQYFSDAACKIPYAQSDDYTTLPLVSKMIKATGTCQPSCKKSHSATITGITSSLSSVMPSSSQLIPKGYTPYTTAGYIQQIKYSSSSCASDRDIIFSSVYKANTCQKVIGDIYAMYTIGTNSAGAYSYTSALYFDSACTQMIAFGGGYSTTDGSCSATYGFLSGYVPYGALRYGVRYIVSTTQPALPSIGATVG
jgi:hypothetical protein